MATYLYRLGRWSYDRRRLVLGALAGRAGRRRRVRRRVLGPDRTTSSRCPGTESQQAQELLEQKYPAAVGRLRPRRLRRSGG